MPTPFIMLHWCDGWDRWHRRSSACVHAGVVEEDTAEAAAAQRRQETPEETAARLAKESHAAQDNIRYESSNSCRVSKSSDSTPTNHHDQPDNVVYLFVALR